jgi:hypothetical protein
VSDGRYEDTDVVPFRSTTVICVRVASPEMRAEPTLFASIVFSSSL